MARKKEETAKAKPTTARPRASKAKDTPLEPTAAKPTRSRSQAPTPVSPAAAPAPAAPEPEAQPTAEIGVLQAILTSQQNELEQRRVLLQQVEWRERLLADELEVARAHADDLERRLQEVQEWQNDLESELSMREMLLSEHRETTGELHRELETLRADNERLAGERQDLTHRVGVQEQALRKLEKTLEDRAEELAELAALVEEADAREDQLRLEHKTQLKELQARLGEPSPELLELLTQARQQLQAMGQSLAQAQDRATQAESDLAGSTRLLDEVEEAFERGEGLERVRVRIKMMRGSATVLDELREKELQAERRAEASHSEMVAMRARMLEAHNELEASEIARKRAEQRVATLEDQLRTSSGR